MMNTLQIATNMAKQTKLVFEELSYKITGILFEVHNEIGKFGREKQCADLLEKKLREKGLSYGREVKIGDSGNTLDFLIEASILLELQAKLSLVASDYEQIKRYLQSAQLKLGLLVNFRSKYLQPKRVLHTISSNS